MERKESQMMPRCGPQHPKEWKYHFQDDNKQSKSFQGWGDVRVWPCNPVVLVAV